jgi:HSP20 family protein
MLSNPFDFRASFREMERLRREMNTMFDQVDRSAQFGTAAGYPAMNVWANDNDVIITAELPGIDLDTLEISVHNDTLTLSGERMPDRLEEGEAYHRQERGFGKFNRAFQLPFQIAAGEVEAGYKNGVLQITLPRAESDKPKKIQVLAK